MFNSIVTWCHLHQKSGRQRVFLLHRPPPSTFGHKFGAKLLTGLSRRNERISWDELSGEVEKKNAAGGNLVFFGFIVAAYVFFS